MAAIEPESRRAIGFIDGQNLYHHAKAAFGHHHPNYDPLKLMAAVCTDQGWRDCGVRFYTGTPNAKKSPMWHGYWANRLLAMRRAGVLVTDRKLRYYQTEIELEDGSKNIGEAPQEKGIDVRIALDIVRLTYSNQLDVAIIFSQDQDLSEVAEDVREIARAQDRWIKVVSAFPSSSKATASRGLNGTDWFKMNEEFYNKCLDQRDYRPKK